MAQPSGFVDVLVTSSLIRPIGITFDANGQMYGWEKQGRVFVFQNGSPLPQPLLDIQEEVANHQDMGLSGMELDPDFINNGYFYVFYAVDRHHLMNFGTPSYDPNTNEYQQATIARITRFTADAGTNFTTLVPNSRLVLVGTSPSDGFPILSPVHGSGLLSFGSDGTLLAGMGDGFFGAVATYEPQAIADGIITAAEAIGPWRSQSIHSANGKIHRLDPATGNGVPSNPFYNAGDPRAVASRVFALGLRNPFSFIRRPNTGSTNPADANPGIYMIGEVGRNFWEELDIMDAPGQNFGWPIYEGIFTLNAFGIEDNQYAPTPGGCGQTYYTYNQMLSENGSWPDPCNPGFDIDGSVYPLFTYQRPVLDWKHGANIARIPNGMGADTLGNPGAAITAAPFEGKCSIAGFFYTGTNFPAIYHNKFFLADFTSQWMRVLDFDPTTHALVSIDTFQNSGLLNPTSFAISPTDDGVFYVNHLNNQIRKLLYQPSNLDPVAIIGQNQVYGPEPLNVQFNGLNSYDPDNDPLTYEWDFDDGSPLSNQTQPGHNFNPANGQPTAYYVTLTVTDGNTGSDTETRVISVNNTPPQIQSTSLDNIYVYPMSFTTTYPLSAVVTDNEHGPAELSYSWLTALHHDTHNHPEPEDISPTSSLSIAPVGCDTVLYFYRTTLIVTDDAGLSDTAFIDLYPDCGGPIVQTDWLTFVASQNTTLDVLLNDQPNGSPLDLSSLTIIDPPQHGSAVVMGGSGQIQYTPGTTNEADVLTYMISDQAGNPSAVGQVNLSPHFPQVLGLDWISFEAIMLENSAQLSWMVNGETDGQYVIERASPKGTFEPLGTLPANGQRIYDFRDEVPLSGDAYYRVRQQDEQGQSHFSPVRRLRFSPFGTQSLQLYPNPVPHGQNVVLQLRGKVKPYSEIQILDMQGRVIYEQLLLEGLQDISLPTRHWATGTYLVRYLDENVQQVGKLIIK